MVCFQTAHGQGRESKLINVRCPGCKLIYPLEQLAKFEDGSHGCLNCREIIYLEDQDDKENKVRVRGEALQGEG